MDPITLKLLHSNKKELETQIKKSLNQNNTLVCCVFSEGGDAGRGASKDTQRSDTSGDNGRGDDEAVLLCHHLQVHRHGAVAG